MTTSAADLVQAAIDNLAALRNAAGQRLSIVRDAVSGAVSAAGQGRIVVAPGQTIGSGWGNSVWDQSVNAFATAQDRDAQWPAPQDGAVCYLKDTKVWQGYTAGAGWAIIAPRPQSFTGAVFIGAAYNAAKPIQRLAGRMTGTSDASAGYLPQVPLPGGVTAILAVNISNQGGICYTIPRTDGGLAYVQMQTRLYSNGAASASQPFTVIYEILYQI